MGLVLGITVLGSVHAQDLRKPPAKQSSIIPWLVKNKCEQVSTDRRYRLLGSLIESDDVDREEFGFVICQRWSLNSGDWDVIIQSNRAVGAGLTPAEAEKRAANAAAAGQGFVKFGLPFNPLGKLDHRRVEYLLHQERGKPVALELVLILRDSKRAAKKPKLLRVMWPKPPL
jgi:hypothetical protein